MDNLPTPTDVQKALVPLATPLPNIPVITGTEEYEEAGAALRDVKERQRRLDTLRKSMTQPIDAAKRAVMGAFDPELTRLSRHELLLKNAMKEYLALVERSRLALEAKLREERRAEQEAAEKRAEKLREKGRDLQAEAVLESVRPVPLVIAEAPKAPGISTRSTWKASISNLPAFIQWCLDEGQYDWLKPDMAELNAYARQSRGSRKVGGVDFYEETGIVAR